MPVGCSATVTRSTARTRMDEITTVSDVARSKPGLLVATTPLAATLRRDTSKTAAATQAQTATLRKIPAKPLSVIQATVATISRGNVFTKILATTQKVGIGNALQTLTLTATQASTATFTAIKQVNRTLTATQAQAATNVRQTLKQLTTGTMMALPPIFHSLVPVATLDAVKTIGQTLTVATTATADATVSKVATVVHTATQATAAVVNKIPARTFSTTANTLGSLIAQKVQHVATLTATQASTATLRRAVAVTHVADAVVTAATTVNTASRTLAATCATTAAPLQRAVSKFLRAAQPQSATTIRTSFGRILTARLETVARIRHEAHIRLHRRFDPPKPRSDDRFDPPEPRSTRWP